MVTKHCIPHMKGDNCHILTMSPPVTLHPSYFEGHTGYTLSKMGMSLCAYVNASEITKGFSAEFASQGIASNTLWPKTSISTAAVKNKR